MAYDTRLMVSRAVSFAYSRPPITESVPNAACVVSLVDRLMHRAEVVRIEGDSYRAKEAQERSAARLKQRAIKPAAKKGKA